MPKIWFITGASRGFGRALVQAALDAGDCVVATARKPEQLLEFAEQFGNHVFPVALDVTDPTAVRAAVEAGVQQFGRLDVVVNNAGYANVAAIETGDEADFRAQFETNFWGVYHVSRAVIAQMRAQGGGILVQFSSIAGRIGDLPAPGVASYRAAKFAVDGFSRSLAAETAPFGLKVMVVEPSGFATDWAGSSMTIHDVPDDYDATIRTPWQTANDTVDSPYRAGDPKRAAAIIIQTVKRDNLPSHLLLGVNAVNAALAYSKHQIEEATAWKLISYSADFSESYPADFPADVPTNADRLRTLLQLSSEYKHELLL
jgi:NAD(P)-dependent dehydrogenase (short-subunit alcohol dehydrogenase family)